MVSRLPANKNHRAVNDKAGVITAVKTTTGAMDEASELFELIERHERVTASKTRVAVADSRYGNTANLIALAQRKIRVDKQNAPADRFPRCADCAVCCADRPHERNGLLQVPGGRDPFSALLCCHSRLLRVSAQVGTRARCRLRQFCTRDKSGRTLNHYEGQELLDKARKQSLSP